MPLNSAWCFWVDSTHARTHTHNNMGLSNVSRGQLLLAWVDTSAAGKHCVSLQKWSAQRKKRKKNVYFASASSKLFVCARLFHISIFPNFNGRSKLCLYGQLPKRYWWHWLEEGCDCMSEVRMRKSSANSFCVWRGSERVGCLKRTPDLWVSRGLHKWRCTITPGLHSGGRWSMFMEGDIPGDINHMGPCWLLRDTVLWSMCLVLIDGC